MRVTETDRARFIEFVVSVAGAHGVGDTDGGEGMAFLESLKVDIVTAWTNLLSGNFCGRLSKGLQSPRTVFQRKPSISRGRHE